MVDREARKKAAQILRDLLEGKISNDEFEDPYPYPVTKDRALWAIFWEMWLHLAEDAEVFLVGEHEPSDEDRARMLRSVAFLESDLEYEWPSQLGRLLNWLTGRASPERAQEVWPFRRRGDLKAAQGRSG